MVSIAPAEVFTGVGGDTDWLNDANWQDGSSPGNNATFSTLYIQAEVDYTVTQGTCTETYDFHVGEAADAGILNLLGGIIQANNTWGVIVGQQGTGTLNINGGSFIQQNDKPFRIGNESAGKGTVNLISGILQVASVNEDWQIGRNGATGLLDISGGTATFASAPTFGSGTGSINFTADSVGSLTITGADKAYYEGIYAAGNLTYSGINTSIFDDVFFVTGEIITADLSDRRAVIAPSAISIVEGDSDSYSISLVWNTGFAPTADVQVIATPTANGQSVSLNGLPAGQTVTLTFTTAAGYDTPQNITVFAINDEVDTGNRDAVIEHTVTSTDTNWNVVTTGNETVTIYDDESMMSEYDLWYDEPAMDWEREALPIGNGRLGAMIFGGVAQEHIQFNEDSLWKGDENPSGVWNPPDGGMGAYQNFGDIYIDFDNQESYGSYQRSLNINEAVHTITYQSGGVTYTREYFSSADAQIAVLRFTADQAGSYNGIVTLQDAHSATTTAASNKLTASGTLSNGLQYESQLLVFNEGGTLSIDTGGVRFQDANSVTLLLAADTDYLADHTTGWRGAHPSSQLAAQLQAALGRSYSDLLTEHITSYQSLFGRMTLDLDADPAKNFLTTDQRLSEYKGGADDRGLEAFLFQYGRYLLICSSRPSEGAIGANLQGLWNNSNDPAWASDYHTNINIQMNYWPAEVTNLSECHRVLLDQVVSQVPVWRTRTNEAFSTRGWAVRTSHNLFGGMAWNWNKPGNAWYAQHFWEHYAFNQDQDYLRNVAYPLLKEVCQFWQDHLVEREHPDFPGTQVLVSPNDWSPEHGPWEDGVSYAQQFVYDVFTNYIEASTLLDFDASFRADVIDMRSRLLGPRIGSWGQLREWMYTDDSPTDEHRHLSHLVAAYPGHQITLDDTPILAEAVKISLNARGIDGPGWSRSWKINLWARLREAEKAYEAINEQLKNTIYNNLFNVHPPFQIDGNFGYTAGLAEMLLQSHNGVIQLLPALPSSWTEGNVTGMCARGGFVVNMQWQNSTLKLATIHSPKGGACKLRYGNEEIQFNTEVGKIYYWNPSLKGDFNLDNHVDMLDLSILKSEYLLQESHTESAGLVVIEAEHFADNTPGSGSMAGSEWTQMTGSGSIGDGFMQALPDQGRSINSNLETYSPHLSYPIYFSTAGDYYLWVRGMAADSNADTVHYGADKAAFSFDYNSAVVFPVFAGFSWSSQLGSGGRPVITIDSPGMFSLDFWMREDGTALDRFALTTDVNYNPNSGGEPTESVYQELAYDLNADGIMNLADYALLANDWLEGVY